MKANNHFLQTRKKPVVLLIAAAMGTLSAASAFAADDANTSSELQAAKKQSLDTVVVTGEKVNKSLKDTLTGVTVKTEDEFDNNEIKNLSDLATAAPNVVSESYGTVSIRGINGSGSATGGYAFVTGGRARVATVVDNIPQTWSGYSYTPTKLWDTQQVEILRGPQSTVQGTNAIGGALIVKTNDPSYQYEGAVRAGLDNYENGNIKNNLAVMFNAPLIDNELALRVAVDGTKGDGWLNYAYADSVDMDAVPDNISESKNVNIRTKLLWEPASIPGLSAKLTYKHSLYKGEYINWANDSDDDFASQTLTLGSGKYGNVRLQDSKLDSIATDVSYEISPSLTNQLHLSYLSTDVNFDQYTKSVPVQSDKDNIVLDNRLLINDAQDPLSGILGLYVNHEKSTINVSDKATYDGSGKVLTSAIYGEATYALNNDWKVIGGGRVENEDTDRQLDYRSGTGDVDQDTNKTIFLPKVGVSYAISPATTWGATVQRGYNAGGGALDFVSYDYYYFNKETVIAYESSIKSQLSDAAEVSANMFYNDYSGYQAFVSESGVSTRIKNIDSSHTYGLELAGSLWATNSLKLNSSLGLLDSKIDSDETSNKGNQLPFAPHTNVSAGFTQFVGNDFSFGADVTYVGKYYSDLDNTDDYTAGDYFTANARVKYYIGDFVINGYITNLTNEDIVTFNYNDGRAAVGQTRTYGLSVTYKM